MMKKKIDFNSLPEAIEDLYEKVENIERLIINLGDKLYKPIQKQGEKPKKKRIKRQYPITEEKATVITEPSVGIHDEDALTVEQASAFLEMTKMNLYAHVKLAKIPYVKKGRRLIFSKIELEEWVKSRKIANLNNTKDAITFRDAVKLTGLKPSKLLYEIKKRKVPVIGKKGKLLYYSKRALTEALTSE